MSRRWNRTLHACVHYRWGTAPTNTELVATNHRRLITGMINGFICVVLLLIAGVVFG